MRGVLLPTIALMLLTVVPVTAQEPTPTMTTEDVAPPVRASPATATGSEEPDFAIARRDPELHIGETFMIGPVDVTYCHKPSDSGWSEVGVFDSITRERISRPPIYFVYKGPALHEALAADDRLREHPTRVRFRLAKVRGKSGSLSYEAQIFSVTFYDREGGIALKLP